MKPFVFRAAAALALRQRQEEAAQRELAAAVAEKMAAERDLLAAVADLDRTLARGQRDELRGDVTLRLWYRNWIAGQRLRIERCRGTVAERNREVQEAAGRAAVAHRKRRALERVHERALAAWQEAARLEEQKVIDELASVRFVRGRAGGTV